MINFKEAIDFDINEFRHFTCIPQMRTRMNVCRALTRDPLLYK
ncbi:hypothetical protein HanIR_Chr09g0425471 [Helianthus annuus]|nr:hypothetical protein HanIR_Chr09g0425471 [Helianthus annuus]